MKPIIRKYKEPVIEVPVNNGTEIESIVGNFKDTATTPTQMPKTFKESIMLDNTTNKLHYFDKKNSIWRSTASVFSGKMSSGGTFQLPTGWTGAVLGTGSIQITHTLGTTNFNCIIGPNDANGTSYIITISSSVIDITTYQLDLTAGTLPQKTVGFQFIVKTY